MKRLIIGLVLVLSVIGCAFAEFNNPWQEVCVANSGTTTARVTIEATANQNVFIDRIIARSDSAPATVTLAYRNRQATSFEASSTSIIAMYLSSGNTGSTATTEVQVLPQYTDGLMPIWIGDKGKAIEITLTGSTYAQIIVNGRRGQSYTNDGNISTVKGY